MIIISHRGNLSGPKTALAGENTPAALRAALDAGFEVEADVRSGPDGKLYLGHDCPTFELFLDRYPAGKMWYHAKDYRALARLLGAGYHVFFHDRDDYTLTSGGYIWAYPGMVVSDNGICVLPESNGGFFGGVAGLCTDYPIVYREAYGGEGVFGKGYGTSHL